MVVGVPGAELWCVTRGRGPACLVLSSMGTAPYERMLPAGLDDHLQLTFVDLRGAGRSSGDPSRLSFDVLADDLDAVRRAIGAETVAVFGHSILGVLAIEYARRRAESVSHVITVGTPPTGDMADLSAKAGALFDVEASEERKQILSDNLQALLGNATSSHAMYAQTPMRFYDPRFNAAPLFAGADMKPAFFQHLFGELTPEWRAGAATDLRVPLWLAHGRYDYTSPGSLWDGIAPAFPTVTRRLFDRSGHQPFVEEPDRFVEMLTAWMAPRDLRLQP